MCQKKKVFIVKTVLENLHQYRNLNVFTATSDDTNKKKRINTTIIRKHDSGNYCMKSQNQLSLTTEQRLFKT